MCSILLWVARLPLISSPRTQDHAEQTNNRSLTFSAAWLSGCRHALELSRQERYDDAREAFEQLVQRHPTFCKAWVSYAQVRSSRCTIHEQMHHI